MADANIFSGGEGLPSHAVPNLHWTELRLRFVEGLAFIEDGDGVTQPFPLLNHAHNYVLHGRDDGTTYHVPLEGQRVIVTVSVIDVDLAQMIPK